MSQYGTGQNVPYSGQQEADLVSNPRYTGQSAGTNPLGHDGRGPAEESRYGAVPLSTNTGVDQYGNPRREGVVDRMKDAVGVGPHSGTTGYDARRDEPAYGTPGYDNYGHPRKEGMVDKVKDAVGMGPHSGTHPHDATRGPYAGEGYSNVNRPGEERGFGGGLAGRPHGTTTGYDQFGVGSGLGTGHHHDSAHVVPGTIPVAAMGERRVEPGYDASRGHIGHNNHGALTGGARKEGIVDKVKDAVGMGKHDNVTHTHPGATTGTVLPNTYGTGETGLGYQGNTTSAYGSTPGYSHHSMVDTGLGHDRHPGSNTGYPHETMGERVEDAVGVGHHGAAGYPHNTTPTYPGSTTSAYPGSTTGYPHETMGDKVKDAVGVDHRDTAGYPHQGVTGTDYDHERRGKGFEDTTGVMHDTRTGPGYDATRTGTGIGDTNVDYPHNDANAYGIDNAPPKKGIVTKIKEKLHH